MFDTLSSYGMSLLEGAWLTAAVSLISLLVATLLGLAGALAKRSGHLYIRLVADLYTTIIRGIPDLVLMLLVFYGGQQFVNQAAVWVGYDEYIDINPFVAGVITLGFIYGAYMTETFRGAMLAVPKGQLEAGYAYGMTPAQVLLRILLPQTVRYALPGFRNNWMVLLKATALVSIIGLEDLVRKAALAAGSTRMPFTFYLAAAVGFLLFTFLSEWFLRWLERRYSLGVREA